MRHKYSSDGIIKHIKGILNLLQRAFPEAPSHGHTKTTHTCTHTCTPSALTATIIPPVFSFYLTELTATASQVYTISHLDSTKLCRRGRGLSIVKHHTLCAGAPTHHLARSPQPLTTSKRKRHDTIDKGALGRCFSPHPPRAFRCRHDHSVVRKQHHRKTATTHVVLLFDGVNQAGLGSPCSILSSSLQNVLPHHPYVMNPHSLFDSASTVLLLKAVVGDSVEVFGTDRNLVSPPGEDLVRGDRAKVLFFCHNYLFIRQHSTTVGTHTHRHTHKVAGVVRA